jgi:hypothetical protein
MAFTSLCIACVYKVIAHVYSTALHKNLIDDEIAFTYIFLFYRLYKLNVRNNQPEAYAGNHTYLPVQSTQLQYVHILLYMC